MIQTATACSKKMLTRHFYELDEVCMALLDTLRHSSLESVFWARELILSEEDEVLYKTMIKAWLMYLGPDRIDWLTAFTATASTTCKLNLIAEFCEIRSHMKKRRMPIYKLRV